MGQLWDTRHGSGSLSIISILFFCALLFSSLAASQAVLAIDYGQENIKAALVKPGIPLEIVMTKDSKRKEVAAVAFKPHQLSMPASADYKDKDFIPKERAFGVFAISVWPRVPSDIYRGLKQLLGKFVMDPNVVQYSTRNPNVMLLPRMNVEGRSTISFETTSSPDKKFHVEELVAMELENIKNNAQKMAGSTPVRHVVFSVPAFWTSEEKYSLKHAATIAGLNVIAMVHDGTAVAINYATTRQFPKDSKPETHLIFDMGAGSTTATIVKIGGKEVKSGFYNTTVTEISVLGVGYDGGLGGHLLDDVIFSTLGNAFVESPKADSLDELKAERIPEGGTKLDALRSNGRAYSRLTKEAQRVRQILSANNEVRTGLEELVGELDLRYKLTRADFEKLCEPYFERVKSVIDDAVTAAGENLPGGLKDVDTVILHGGASRTPWVQRELEKVVGSKEKISRSVNSDEAAVFGAAFKGAGMSGGFRVRDIRVRESVQESVLVKYTRSGDDKVENPKAGRETVQTIFSRGTLTVGKVKQIAFPFTKNFSFRIVAKKSKSTESTTDSEDALWKVQSNNLTSTHMKLVSEGCATDDISVKFGIKISDLTGLAQVMNAEASCEVEKVIQVAEPSTKTGGIVDGVKGMFGFGKDKEKEREDVIKDGKAPDQVPIQGSGIDPEIEKLLKPDEADASTMTKLDYASVTPTPSTTPDERKTKTVKQRFVIPIDFTVTKLGFPEIPADALQQSVDKLAQFSAHDLDRLRREEGRNTLEAYIYKARELKDNESFRKYGSEAELASLDKLLAYLSDDFMSGGDAETAASSLLKSKLDELKAATKPMVFRKDEAERRADHVQRLRDTVKSTKSIVETLSESIKHAEEAAVSIAAEAALKSSSDAAAKASSATSEAPIISTAPATDHLDDLEDTTSSDSTSPTSTSTEPPNPTESPAPPLANSKADITALQVILEEADTWIETKVAEQEKLPVNVDPVLLVKDMEKKATQLNKEVMRLLQKAQHHMPKFEGAGDEQSSTKTKSTKKTKPAKKTSSASSAKPKASKSSTSKNASTTPKTSPKAAKGSNKASPPEKDEL